MPVRNSMALALLVVLAPACRGKDTTVEIGQGETGQEETGQEDTGPVETGLEDTGPTDTAPPVIDDDGDGFDDTVDCDDSDAAIHPDAEEVCDLKDNNCDGTIDENEATDATAWYPDGDGDGWGAGTATVACVAPAGFVLHDGDCDDADPSYHPGASETDCTDPNDYNCDGSVGWADADGDGHAACEDCDDTDASANDAADEVCDGVDNDCDSEIDESSAVDATPWYGDADGDGYGGTQFQQTACSAPTGFVASADDCDDLDATSHPGATEICDEADNNCDGTVDEGVTSPWYADGDGDGFGDASNTTDACAPPPGYSTNGDDCDDTAAAISPAALEFCDGIDNDCDSQVDEADALNTTTWYTDADGDGYGDPATGALSCSAQSGQVSDNTDCNDDPSAGGASQSPGQAETCDGVDNDCNGTVDDNAGNGSTYYLDADNDGYGAAAYSVSACSQPSGYIDNSSDCDDGDSAVNPGGTETCDGADNDCDGQIDEGWQGNSALCAAASCDAVLSSNAAAVDGLYWLDPDQDGDPTDSWQAWCDMSADGGGWTRMFSSHYPTFWSSSAHTDVGSPNGNDYSKLMDLADFSDATGTFTLRLEVGNSATWNTGTRSHFTVWTQGHNPFGATTDGSDYTLIDGEESTTCSGFNGLHDRYYTASGVYAMSSDVDIGDGVGCWWMQIVPLAQYSSSSSYPGYLEGYGGPNTHTWQTLWVR